MYLNFKFSENLNASKHLLNVLIILIMDTQEDKKKLKNDTTYIIK